MLGAILGSIAGSVVTGLFNKSSAEDNRDFQRDMSGTAHQREVDDLIKAGLNPMLSARLGGASTPGGSTATMPDLGQTLNSAFQNQTVRKQVESQTEVNDSQVALNEALAQKAAAETRSTTSTAQHSEWQMKRLEYLENKFDSWFVEGKELEVRQARAVYEQFMASRDYNVVHALDRFAQDHGFQHFTTAIESQKFRTALQEYVGRELTIAQQALDTPRLRALENFYKSDYGQRIAPFMTQPGGLSDILGLGSSAAGIADKLFGKKPPINIFKR